MARVAEVVEPSEHFYPDPLLIRIDFICQVSEFSGSPGHVDLDALVSCHAVRLRNPRIAPVLASCLESHCSIDVKDYERIFVHGVLRRFLSRCREWQENQYCEKPPHAVVHQWCDEP